MGEAIGLVCMAKYGLMGDGFTDGFAGMDWIYLDWMANHQRGLAQAYSAMGLECVYLHLAIFDIQPFNAIPAIDLPHSGDLCRLGINPNL